MPKIISDASDAMTPEQERGIKNHFTEVLLRLAPTKADAQRIMRRIGELRSNASETLTTLGGMRYRSERFASTYGYTLSVKPVCEQLLMLKSFPLFQKLDCFQALNCAKSMAQIPEGADGNFVFPYWGLIGKTYAEATERVAQELVRVYNMKNRLERRLSEKHLRQYDPTRQALEAIRAAQPGDFQIFPVQFGILHRGESVRLVRDILLPKEFGLGPYEVGIMLLTHPERLDAYEKLFIDCPGAEYDYDVADRGRVPCFYLYDGQWRFNSNSVDAPCDHYGSASAFFPQSKP